jgi:hypothetical protein
MRPTGSISLVAALLTVSCGPDSKQGFAGEWTGTVEVRDGAAVVQTPAEPLLGQLLLELEQDLVVGDTLHETESE